MPIKKQSVGAILVHKSLRARPPLEKKMRWMRAPRDHASLCHDVLVRYTGEQGGSIMARKRTRPSSHGSEVAERQSPGE